MGDKVKGDLEKKVDAEKTGVNWTANKFECCPAGMGRTLKRKVDTARMRQVAQARYSNTSTRRAREAVGKTNKKRAR